MYSALICRNLAREAEANMETVTPPLFLRFVNLLMNDAVFLLDEALSNMAELRQLQTAREAGEWEQLPIHEREYNERYLEHIGTNARFVCFFYSEICFCWLPVVPIDMWPTYAGGRLTENIVYLSYFFM